MDKVVVDPADFRRVLSRNVVWPLALGLLSAVFFVAIINYLLSVNRWIESAELAARGMNEVMKDSLDRETGLRGYVITGSEAYLEPYLRTRGTFRPQLDALRGAVDDQPEQLRRIDAVQQLSDRWAAQAEATIAARREGGDVGVQVRSGRAKVVMDELRAEIGAFVDAQDRIKRERLASAKVVVYGLVGAFLAFSIAVAALLAWRGRRDLLHLSATYGRALQRQAEHAETLQHQAWLRGAQTQLADRVAGRLSMPAVCSNILQVLCRYLDAAVGAVYVMDPQSRLQRAATYAFAADAEQRQQVFRLGESLVGQAALERRPLQLHNVPGDYLNVSSGLGETLATSIVVLPAAADGEVNAVLEIGFARPTGARELELLQQVADNIGSAIATAGYRQQLQQALWETQQLNEELQSQQEELRTANEELEEQARAVEEAQARLEMQHEELTRTNEELEKQSVAMQTQRDVVEQQNAELSRVQRLLEQRADEVERASRYKSEFLANMSHELRTPLNSSLILARLLADNADGNLSADQVRYAESIHAAGNDLLELINDILDISKVEAGKLEIRADHTALATFVEALAAAFRPQAEEKSIEFSVALADGLPATLFVDQKRLAQIVRNLLSNAFKFTGRGGRVTLAVRPDGDARIAFSVRDTGIGIRKEHQQEIFDAFRQGDGATNRQYGGTGLGLSISRELTRLLGGALAVQSEPGVGSEFTLTVPVVFREADPLPAAPAVAAVPAAEAVPPFAPPPRSENHRVAEPFEDDRRRLDGDQRTLLIVEDDPQFARILYDLAHQQHFNCLVAATADAGFEIALAHRPHAILLDMKLPDHSGLVVLERLKSTPQTRHIPVHIVSIEDYSEVALLLGAVGYLTKPVSRDVLQNTLVDLGARLDRKVKNVLVVEDDTAQLASIERLIGDDGVAITGVARGEEALQQLRERVFDCMIIDLHLPDMSGAELLQRMTATEICSFPPVIVYTAAELSSADEAELLRHSRSIIVKGARSPERLLDEVMLFLHKVESELPDDRQQLLKKVRNRERVFERSRILVVDDDVRNIFALTSLLEQKGARVEVARNGREALEALESAAHIDLVLMDIMMPEMDGYEAIQRIRALPRFAKLPIIAVTAKAMRDDQERCLRAGANDYLAKPINLDRLLSLIRVWLPQVSRF